MSTILLFGSIENKYDVYVEKDCMKTFRKPSREHALAIINFLKMKLLTNEQQKSYQNAKLCYICKERFQD